MPAKVVGSINYAEVREILGSIRNECSRMKLMMGTGYFSEVPSTPRGLVIGSTEKIDEKCDQIDVILGFSSKLE